MWKYDEEFYGKWLKLLICGYIRPEKNYDSLRKYKNSKSWNLVMKSSILYTVYSSKMASISNIKFRYQMIKNNSPKYVFHTYATKK